MFIPIIFSSLKQKDFSIDFSLTTKFFQCNGYFCLYFLLWRFGSEIEMSLAPTPPLTLAKQLTDLCTSLNNSSNIRNHPRKNVEWPDLLIPSTSKTAIMAKNEEGGQKLTDITDLFFKTSTNQLPLFTKYRTNTNLQTVQLLEEENVISQYEMASSLLPGDPLLDILKDSLSWSIYASKSPALISTDVPLDFNSISPQLEFPQMEFITKIKPPKSVNLQEIEIENPLRPKKRSASSCFRDIVSNAMHSPSEPTPKRRRSKIQ